MEHLDTDRLLAIELPGNKGMIELRRCDDHFFGKARSLAIPIELRNPRLYSLTRRPSLALPHIYAALSSLTGPSGELYDTEKGAFSFPFKMTVRRRGREHRYLLNVMNFRSMAEPRLYRVLQPDETYRHDICHAPFEAELGEKDLISAFDFLSGFLLGFTEAMPKWTAPFVKEVKSNGILFGYDPTSARFFEQSYDEPEEYSAAFDRWQALLPGDTSARQIVELDWSR